VNDDTTRSDTTRDDMMRDGSVASSGTSDAATSTKRVGIRTGDRIAAWTVRVTWVVAALATPASSPAWWVGWGVVAVASIVLHPVSLGVVRVVAPLVALETILALRPDWRHVAVTATLAAGLVVAFSAEYGRVHVQSAAYGAERRHLLRPPMSVLAVSVVAWIVTAATFVVASFVDDARIGAGLQIIGGLAAAGLAFRATVLSRRWFVVVPAGIVLHDLLLLTDSVMIPRREVTSLAMSQIPATGGALDLTGTTWGTTVVVTAREPHDVSLTEFGTRLTRTGQRLHAGAVRIAPSRPGAALADARR
jgi:hypothetical protein